MVWLILWRLPFGIYPANQAGASDFEFSGTRIPRAPLHKDRWGTMKLVDVLDEWMDICEYTLDG